MNSLLAFRRALWVAAAGLGCLLTGLTLSQSQNEQLSITVPISTTPEATGPSTSLRVEISGGVSQPGVISLPEGSRLIDGTAKKMADEKKKILADQLAADQAAAGRSSPPQKRPSTGLPPRSEPQDPRRQQPLVASATTAERASTRLCERERVRERVCV